MRLVRTMAAAILLATVKASYQQDSGSKSNAAVKFEFTREMLVDMSLSVNERSDQVLQFTMATKEQIDAFYLRLCEKIPNLTPEAVQLFNQMVVPKTDALRNDLAKYLCQPLLERDELLIVVDLLSDRLEVIMEQVQTSPELLAHSSSIRSLVRVALCLGLPPFKAASIVYTGYYPQELLSIIHGQKQYQLGRAKWKEALEKAQRDGLEYEGPVPFVLPRSVTAADSFWQENWSKLPDDVWLYVLCKTGPYIWYSRLVCKKWRSISSSQAVVGVLGYGRAFKALSGRATFDNLVLRLDTLAKMTLDEFNGVNCSASGSDTVGLSGERTGAASAGNRGGTANGLKEIIRVIDPICVIIWYQDAQAKFPGLERVVESSVFALFLDTRDDGCILTLSDAIYYRRAIGSPNSGRLDGNQDIGHRILRAYFTRYREAAKGHPLPAADTWSSWELFKALIQQ